MRCDRPLAHRVDRYAYDVRDGAIVAGPLVRQACAGHLRERDRAHEGWFRFDEARADHVIEFFESVLKLPDLLDADGDPRPFTLSAWQAFIVGSLFGWVDRQGLRRFREAYLETAKGGGKTPLLAGIGLFGLTMDGERAAEIYSAASDASQAAILFRDAERMARVSPGLADELSFAGNEHVWQMSHPTTLSTFRMFSRESGEKSGPRPHMALIDELHEHSTPQITVNIRAGAKRRLQPLFVEATNAGFDRASICWQRHEHARRVLEGVVEDDRFFAYVCALDDGDQPLEDEACWPKANPNLGVSVGLEYLRRQVANAKHIPAETNAVLRLNFCVWTSVVTRFFATDKWQACAADVPDDALVGVPCFAAMAFGATDEIASFARLWLLPDGRRAVRVRYWVPRGTVEREPDRPYASWESRGLLTITDGDTVDDDAIEDAVQEDCRESGVTELAYDKRTSRQAAIHWEGAGVPVVDVPSGFALTEALRTLSTWVADGSLCHGGDPVLAWMADNTVVRPGRDQTQRLDTEQSMGPIVGIAALAMATARAIAQPPVVARTHQMFFLGVRP